MARRPDASKPEFIVGDSLADIFAEAGIRFTKGIPAAGTNVKTICPKCGGGKTREPSLSVRVDADGAGAAWHCFRTQCGEWRGNGKTEGAGMAAHDRVPARRERPPPVKPTLHTQREKLDPEAGLYAMMEKRGISRETVDEFGIYAVGRRWPETDASGKVVIDEARGETRWVDKATIVFPYRWRGEVVNRKFRSKDKQFAQDRDSLRTLFNADAITSPDVVVLVEGECFPGDAEVLTRDGWLRLDAYAGQDVAQWDAGQISMVRPKAFVQRPSDGSLVRIESKGYLSLTTDGHRIPRILRSGRVVFTEASEMRKSIGGHIPRAGVLNGPGIALTDEQLQFAVAVAADAAIDDRRNTGPRKGAELRYARMAFKRSRKVDRMRALLARLGLSHTESFDGRRGYVFFGVPLPDWVPGRHLPWRWVTEATARQREMLLAELREWDGNAVVGRRQDEFSSKHQSAAEWVQALCHTTGRCSSIMRRQNAHGSWFKVSMLHSKATTSTQCLRVSRENHDGEVFCLTVPSGALLIRQDEKITISGNCDVLACWEAGLRQVVSLPDGAPGKLKDEDDPSREGDLRFDPLENCADVIENVQKFVIATDMDVPGGYLAEEFARRLGRHRCWRASWPDGCKDANDVLLKHGRDVLVRCVEEAEPWPLAGLFTLRRGALREFLTGGQEPHGLECGIKALDEVVRLPAGGGWLTVVTGIPSHGKSAFLRSWLPYLSMKHDVGIVWCSPEDNRPEILALGIAQVVAGQPVREAGTLMPDHILEQCEDWIRQRVTFVSSDDPDTDMTLEWLLDRAEEAKRRFHRQLLVLDPWNEVEHLFGKGESETQYTGRWLRKIKAWGRAEGMGVLIAVHPKQQMKDPKTKKYPVVEGYDISGSANWFNRADLGLTIYREIENEVQVKCWKARFPAFGKRYGLARLKRDPRTGRLSSIATLDEAQQQDGEATSA